MWVPLIINKCKVCTLVAWVSAINMTSLSVKSLSDKVCNGYMDLSSLSTGCTSQASVYLGRGGLRLNTPFINLITNGWLPALQPFTMMPIEERARLAVLTDT